MDKFKNSLAECQVMAEDYLAHRTASKQKLMINSLQAIAKKLNLEFYVIPVGDDMATDVTSDPVQTTLAIEVIITSATFVVSVRILLFSL